MTLGTGPAMSAQLIASGIENMQVQYGVSTASRHALLRRVDGSGVAVDERRSPCASGSSRASTHAEPGNVSTAAYTMGDQTYPDRSTPRATASSARCFRWSCRSANEIPKRPPMNVQTQNRRPRRQRGASSLFLTVILVMVVMLLAVTASVLSNTQFRLAGNLQFENVAFNLAEGADRHGGKLAQHRAPMPRTTAFTTYSSRDAGRSIPSATSRPTARSADDDLGRCELHGGRRRRQPALSHREIRRRQPAARHRTGHRRPAAHRLARKSTCS